MELGGHFRWNVLQVFANGGFLAKSRFFHGWNMRIIMKYSNDFIIFSRWNPHSSWWKKYIFFRSRVFMWHWPFFRNHHGFSWTLHHFTIQNRITPNFLKWHVHVSWWKILWKHNFSWWNHQFLDDEMVWHGPFSIVGPPGGAGASAVGGPSSAERAERLSAGNVGKNVVRSGDWSMNQIHLDGYMVYKVYTTYKNGDLGI